ncbi:MAG: AAA family ATPase [Ferruginibacter sp.]
METDKNLYRYPGTKPFEANEYKLFKGRGEDIQKLQELISLQNLIVLYSRSGLGKSSLLNAGLVNKFREEPGIVPLFVRFGAYYKGAAPAPRERLIQIITEEYHQDFNTFLFKKLIPQEQVTMHLLWYLFKSLQICDPSKETFVIIFDQFEELFTYPESEIEIFKKELSELLFVTVPQQLRNVIKDKLLFDKEYLTKEQTLLLYEPLNIKILFAIRSDKLSLLNKLSDCFPSVLKYCYELNPLSREQAKQAIIIPATLTDRNYISPPFTYAEDTLKLVLNSLTDSGKRDVGSMTDSCQEIETFQLQIVCKYAENLVVEKNIKQITPVDLGNIKEIFENHYRNIINKLSPVNQLPARQLIEEKLIIDGIRVSMPIPFILRDKGMTKELLDELVSTHIIRPEQNNTIEISHDTLIEPILKYYAERKKQEEVENELMEKEAEIQRIREEQQKQIEKQQQKAKRNRLFVTTVSIALLFSIGLVLYALSQKRQADLQRGLADTGFGEALKQKKLANVAEASGKSYRERADSILLLANEARDNADKLKIETLQLKDTINYQKKSSEYQKKIADVNGEVSRLNLVALDLKKNNPTAALRLAEIGYNLGNRFGLGTSILSTANQIMGEEVFYKTVLNAGPGTFIFSSQDGTKILTGNENGEVNIWGINKETPDSKPLAAFKMATAFNWGIFSPDNKKVFACDMEGNIVVFDLKEGVEKRWRVKKPGIMNVNFSGKEDMIMIVSGTAINHYAKELGKIELLDMNGSTIASLKDEVTCAVLSPGGDTILAGGIDGAAKLFDTKGNLLKTFPNNIDKTAITCLAYSKDGTKFLAGYSDGAAFSWEIKNDVFFGKMLKGENAAVPLSIVIFKDDSSNEIFTGTHYGEVQWLQLGNSDYFVKNTFKGHSSLISSIGIHINSKTSFDFFTCSPDGTVRVWHNIEDMSDTLNSSASDAALKQFLAGNKFLDTLTLQQKKEYLEHN